MDTRIQSGPSVGSVEWLTRHNLPVAVALLEENNIVILSHVPGEEGTELLSVTLAYADGDDMRAVARDALQNLGYRVGRWSPNGRDAAYARAILKF